MIQLQETHPEAQMMLKKSNDLIFTILNHRYNTNNTYYTYSTYYDLQFQQYCLTMILITYNTCNITITYNQQHKTKQDGLIAKLEKLYNNQTIHGYHLRYNAIY